MSIKNTNKSAKQLIDYKRNVEKLVQEFIKAYNHDFTCKEIFGPLYYHKNTFYIDAIMTFGIYLLKDLGKKEHGRWVINQALNLNKQLLKSQEKC
ncbi:MAG TPA: hypothetical protein ENI76_06900 [Ignavibacteria bacterium]|nr:hypothetical protein [Ignavibacteria bacterium]